MLQCVSKYWGMEALVKLSFWLWGAPGPHHSSVLKIGNTPSRVPHGRGARQRCPPRDSAIARESVKAMGTPQRRTLLTRPCSHGHDERLCWASPRRIGWVQIIHAGRQNWRPMGRLALVLARNSCGHIGRYSRPLRREDTYLRER
jgi:hypothetical protein